MQTKTASEPRATTHPTGDGGASSPAPETRDEDVPMQDMELAQESGNMPPLLDLGGYLALTLPA